MSFVIHIFLHVKCTLQTTSNVPCICTLQSTNESKFKLMDLFNCLINMSNELVDKSDSYRILDNLFDDQTFNLNQTKDDIFNIYMYGYINTSEIIFKNYLSLKG